MLFDRKILQGRGEEYPEALAEAERERIGIRRAKAQEEAGTFSDGLGASQVAALALSGGGIRSATFCLGVLRGLAKYRVLPRIDYLSTVSGGGYIGGFLGALIQREGLKQALAELEDDPPPLPRPMECGGQKEALSSPIRWLRENGRYLAPRGSGDVLLMATILLRNWAAMHVVLGTLFLGIMLALKGAWSLPWMLPWLQWTIPAGASLWWSPWIALAGALFLVMVVPPGWAYWMVEADGEDYESPWLSPVRVAAASTILFFGVGLAGLLPAVSRATASLLGHSWVAWLGFGVSFEGLQALMWFVSLEGGSRVERKEAFQPLPAKRASRLRWRLSRLLASGIALTLLTLFFAVGDTLGQSLYAVRVEKGAHGLMLWATGLFSTASALAVWGRKLADLLPGKKEDVKVPLSLLAGAGASLLLAVLLAGHAALATGISWGFKPVKWPAGKEAQTVGSLLAGPSNPAQKAADSPAATEVGAPFQTHLWFGGLALCAAMTFFAYGRNRAFLNLSAMGSFYQTRLARTYLGASNRWRRERNTSPRDEAPGDDLPHGTYRSWERGGPLHLVNVTINETLDGATHIQNQDRKGTPMAAGPVGLSVGVRHHAAWSDKDSGHLIPMAADGASQWTVFLSPGDQPLAPQPLTLGQWVGISGAAFSTGMGFRTSFGLSLLCGFFNIRTGYWWYSGVDPMERASRSASQRGAWHWFSRWLPVQAHLLDEWMARFHGTARRYWYLSDGGHFENTGVYELARRRVPLIILCDAGADSGYIFGDLANLTLKLRNDFGAEMRFLKADQIAAAWGSFREGLGIKGPYALSPALGTFEALRRGTWKEEGGQPALAEPALNGLSKAHATLAQIDYPSRKGEAPMSSLVLIFKPSLTGDEPMDVRYYRQEHAEFPQEPTIDQFFDEAQWEAYRKLGEHAVDAVFG